MGVVALASSDVLPGRAAQKTRIALNDNGRHEHQRDADEAEEHRTREEKDKDGEARNKSGHAPTHTATAVRVDVGFADILRESRILLGQRLFQLGQDSLLVL